jgi:hypothetical protein
VNDNFPRIVWSNNSGLGCWLPLLLLAIFLGSVGLGWVVNGFLILLAVLIVLPVVAFWGFRWWWQRNLVEAACPVCNYEFTGFNRTECRCPNCGEPLKVEGGRFLRLTPPGTIDVEAIDVSVKQLEDS